EGRNGRVALSLRRRDLGVCEQLVNVCARGHVRREEREEVGTLHEVSREVLLVCRELLLPVALAHDDAAPDLLRVSEELAVARESPRVLHGVGEGGLVEAY